MTCAIDGQAQVGGDALAQPTHHVVARRREHRSPPRPRDSAGNAGSDAVAGVSRDRAAVDQRTQREEQQQRSPGRKIAANGIYPGEGRAPTSWGNRSGGLIVRVRKSIVCKSGGVGRSGQPTAPKADGSQSSRVASPARQPSGPISALRRFPDGAEVLPRYRACASRAGPAVSVRPASRPAIRPDSVPVAALLQLAAGRESAPRSGRRPEPAAASPAGAAPGAAAPPALLRQRGAARRPSARCRPRSRADPVPTDRLRVQRARSTHGRASRGQAQRAVAAASAQAASAPRPPAAAGT